MKDTPDPQLRKQLQAYDKKFDEVFDKNDAAAMAALYTEDAVMVPVAPQTPNCPATAAGLPSRALLSVKIVQYVREQLAEFRGIR